MRKLNFAVLNRENLLTVKISHPIDGMHIHSQTHTHTCIYTYEIRTHKRMCTHILTSTVKHINLIAGTVRVGYGHARSDDVEGGVNVHGVGVLEGEDVKTVVVSEVSSHPLNPHHVCNLNDKGNQMNSMSIEK